MLTFKKREKMTYRQGVSIIRDFSLYVCGGIFLITGLVTLSAILGLVEIKSIYLGILFCAFFIELIATLFLLYHYGFFFDDEIKDSE